MLTDQAEDHRRQRTIFISRFGFGGLFWCSVRKLSSIGIRTESIIVMSHNDES